VYGSVLIAIFVVVDLLLARRLFDGRLAPLLQEPSLSVKDLVVHFDDIGVAHRCDAMTHDDARSGEVRGSMIASSPWRVIRS